MSKNNSLSQSPSFNSNFQFKTFFSPYTIIVTSKKKLQLKMKMKNITKGGN